MADFRYPLPKRGYGTHVNGPDPRHVPPGWYEQIARDFKAGTLSREQEEFMDQGRYTFGGKPWREVYKDLQVIRTLQTGAHRKGHPIMNPPRFRKGQWVQVIGHTKDDEGIDNSGSIGFITEINPDFIEIYVERGHWFGHIAGFDRRDLAPVRKPVRISMHARHWLKRNINPPRPTHLVDCPRCGGQGYNEGEGGYPDRAYPCYRCGTTGQIEAPVPTRREEHKALKKIHKAQSRRALLLRSKEEQEAREERERAERRRRIASGEELEVPF